LANARGQIASAALCNDVQSVPMLAAVRCRHQRFGALHSCTGQEDAYSNIEKPGA